MRIQELKVIYVLLNASLTRWDSRQEQSGAKEDLVSIKFVQPEFILWWIKHDKTVHQLIQQIFTKLHLNYELQCADKFEPLQLMQGSFYLRTIGWPMSCTLNFSPEQMKAEYHELSFAAPAPAEMRNFFSSSRKASMPYPWSDSSQHWWNSTAVQYHTKRWEKSGLPVLTCDFSACVGFQKVGCIQRLHHLIIFSHQVFDLPLSGRCWTHWSLARC